ncbi:MAG: hypothetical protein ACREJC_23145 [Tepidisphaeraceae bacterium]
MMVTVTNHDTGYEFTHLDASQVEVNHLITWMSAAKSPDHWITIVVTPECHRPATRGEAGDASFVIP